MRIEKPAFPHLLFYNLSKKQYETIETLKSMFPEECQKVSWHFANSENRVSELAMSRMLVVTGDAEPGDDAEIFLKNGMICRLSFSRFMEDYSKFFKSGWAIQPGIVNLAFLDMRMMRILTTIFTLAGFKVIESHTIQDVQRFVKDGPGYMVLDLDMKGASVSAKTSDQKKKLISLIKTAKNQNLTLSVSVIKDFSQGSLFDDITSCVRDITNLMLSAEEYIFFIRDYLFQSQLKKIEMNYREILAKSSKESSDYKAGKKENLNLNIFMRNAKQAFEKVKNAEFQISKASIFQYEREISAHLFRLSCMSWLDKLSENNETTGERACFSFYPAANTENISIEKEMTMNTNSKIIQMENPEINSENSDSLH